MDTGNEPPRRGKTRISELGPAWITAIATLIVALTSAGFFAGRATAPAETDAIQPTTTTTSRVTETPIPPASASSTEIPQGTSNGTQLGSYSINLSAGYYVPLGPTEPTQPQFTTNSNTGDIHNNGPYIFPIGKNKIVSLPGGTTPTYEACTTETLFVNRVDAKEGTAFCLVETGRMVGITVTSVNTVSPSYAALQVTVWQNI